MRPEGCALVTGGSRGIGAAAALALAAAGWPLGVGARSDVAGLDRTVASIVDSGGRAVPLVGDVSSADTADELVTRIEAEFGPLLVLVNNAGVRADALALQLDDEAWGTVLETNLSAAFRLTRRALRSMLRARFGRVINIASVVGPRANPGQANYAASKAGLIGMTKTVAAEVARRGVTVNAVAPGLIDTELTADLGPELVSGIPVRRAGTAAEVAACIRFLASDEASYVTGTTLTVDGGMSA